MPVVLKRSDLKRLAEMRLTDAQSLLVAKRFAGAYYMAGYAVECALKACIAKQTQRYDFPDIDHVRKSHTQDLTELLRLAGIQPDLVADMEANAALRLNWTVVKDWSVESRYVRMGQLDARDLYDAVGNPTTGVLEWVRQRW